MKLPFSFLKSNKADADYFLALIITDEKVSAVILQAGEGTLKQINANETFFDTSIEDLTIEDLINTADKAISRAEEILPPDIQTHQTVFGVKENWVEPETKKIKKDYLDKLKKLCDSLDLKPVGFMVTTEAITHLMQDEEGAPLSALFAEIHKKEVTLSLMRGGKVLESFSSPHLESTPATVDKLLGHFSVPVLPARIVVFQAKPEERTSQAFLRHHWSKSLPFLHVPQVTLLPEGFDIRSVVNGAATQMGFRVLEPKHEILPKIVPNPKDEAALAADDEALANVVPVPESENADQEAALLAEEASDFGFVMDQDIDKAGDTAGKETAATEFPETGDVEQEEDFQSSRAGTKPRHPLDAIKSIKLPKNIAVPFVGRLLDKFKNSKSSLKFILPIVGIMVLLVGLTLFYFYGMKANVVLTMTPNMIDQKNTVTFSTSESNDFGNNIIAAKQISTSINAQVSTNATGKKDVGDKAKGTVTIYNTSSGTVSLSSGTQITASNGQVFLLDSDVKVASATGDIFTGTKPGTTDVAVTAKDLGTDGNVPAGTKFAVAGKDSVAGKNDNAFSGGTKKSVTVVSADDLATLRKNIVKGVQNDAQKKLASEASSDEAVLPLTSDPTLQSQHFDKQVGDETKQVSLNANVVFTGIAYSKNDLNDYAKTTLQEKNGKSGNFADNSVNATVGSATMQSKGSATATVMIEGGLLPNLDKQDIINNIKKKSLSEAKASLSSLPQVEQADIIFSPPIPLLPLVYPRLPNTITVETKLP